MSAVFILLSFLLGLQVVDVIEANPIPREPITPCVIEVSSPTESTYSKDVPLIFTVREPDIPWNPCAQPGIGTIYYSLDGKRSDNLFVSSGTERGPLHFSLNLPNLSEGEHTLTILAQVHGLWIFSGNNLTMSEPYTNTTIHFTIDRTFTVDRTAPKISILSEENEPFISSVPLNFKVDTPTSWMGYSLDNQSNSTILGNFTLTNLTDGPHSIIIYANDSTGNMDKSEKFSFAINNPTISPINSDNSLNPTNLESIAIVIIILVVASISLVYFKRRKGKP